MNETPLMQEANDLMRFMTDCERLKREYRHCVLSDGEKEDVAAHTWRAALTVLLLEPYLPRTINVNHLLRMLIVHDLVEVYAGDISASKTRDSASAAALKYQNENAAADRIAINAKSAGPSLIALWREYEQQDTAEARIAKTIDKLEAQLQHNEAGVNTWDEIEIEMITDLESLPSEAPIIASLRDSIITQARQLVRAHQESHRLAGEVPSPRPDPL